MGFRAGRWSLKGPGQRPQRSIRLALALLESAIGDAARPWLVVEVRCPGFLLRLAGALARLAGKCEITTLCGAIMCSLLLTTGSPPVTRRPSTVGGHDVRFESLWLHYPTP